MIDMNKIECYTYDTFLDSIEDIAKQVESSNWVPDYIVGIVRGGLVPAVHLSHRLKLPLATVRWNTRDETMLGNEFNFHIPNDLNNGKKILLVDDIVDGGDTVQELIADWNSCSKFDSSNLRVACIVYNNAQPVAVNYFYREIDRTVDRQWFAFPWEG